MPVIVTVSTKHPFPLGDDGRFPGFAVAIEKDERWVPYKYSENSYYQFFHLIPVIEYILASITGVGVLSVSSYYLTLKIVLYLAYIIFVLLVIRKITGDNIAALISIYLLSVTPPLALSQVVHQSYAIVLFLVSAYFIQKRDELLTKPSILIINLLCLAGIIAHATYMLALLVFISSFVFAKESRENRERVNSIILPLLIISLVYWTYTYVLDIIINPTVNAVRRLMTLFFGEAKLWYGTAQPWYTSEDSVLFIAWALIPSITATHVVVSIPRLLLRRRSLCLDTAFILSFIGLTGTVINYFLRHLPTFGGRYFYWLYLYMLPISALIVRDLFRKVASSIPAIVLISLASFYGIQDPTLAANTYIERIGWADRTSWHISLILSQHIDREEGLIWMDPRLSTPLSSLKPDLLYSGERPKDNGVIAIIGIDDVGKRATSKDPRNVDWFISKLGTHPIYLINTLGRYSVIISFERYIGIRRSP